jgi:rRNA maturation endonuclease Nob1
MPLKREKCDHQWPAEPNCQPAFQNKYRCTNCGTTWSDVWSATCDDECPRCGVDHTPESSVEVAECACAYL